MIEYLLHIAIMINIYIILVLSVNLPVGMANLLTLGQAAFYGIGAYISAFFLIQFNLPFVVIALAVMLLTGLSSYTISLASIKLKGDYFVLATLGFQMIVYTLLYNWTDVTRGPYGIAGIPSIKIVGLWNVASIQARYLLQTIILIIAVFWFVNILKQALKQANTEKKIIKSIHTFFKRGGGCIYLTLLGVIGFFINADLYGYFLLSTIVSFIAGYIFNVIKFSPYGRVLRAIRNDESSVAAMGRNPVLFKSWAFFLSAAFSSLAGLIYASYVSYIDPTSFTLDESLFIISALFIGGTGNIRGPILGALFVVILPEILQLVGLPDAIAANLRQIIYGLALIIVMYFRPQGLWGTTKIS